MHEYDTGDNVGDEYHGPLDGQPDLGSEQFVSLPDAYTVDEAFLRPADESLPAEHPAQIVRAQCVEEVDGVLNTALNQATSDAVTAPSQGNVYLGAIMLEKAQAAAEAGDVDAVELYISGIIMQSREYGPQVVDACMLGVKLGSERATDILRSGLAKEKTSNALYVENNNPMAPPPPTPLLTKLVVTCGKQGTPPDVWLDEYAANPEQHWQQSMRYHGIRVKADAPDDAETAVRQQQFDAKAAELLDGGFIPQIVFKRTWQVLNVVKDPALRERFADNFAGQLSQIAIGTRTFQQVIDIGRQIIADPVLATPERVAKTESTINGFANKLWGYDITDDFERGHIQLFWRADLARYNGATPEELINIVDTYVGELLSADIPDVAQTAQDLTRNRVTVASWRESIMRDYAIFYAEHNNFPAAQLFIGAIANEQYYEAAITSCLGIATAPEQVDSIRPDIMTMAYMPDLAVPVAYAELRLANDINAMADFALGCTPTAMREQDGMHRWYADQAYSFIAKADGPHALAVAGSMLEGLRAIDAPYVDTKALSYKLIAAGDPDEPQRAYDYINRMVIDPSERLFNVWQLAQYIEKCDL
jgi:hypothetical protein